MRSTQLAALDGYNLNHVYKGDRYLNDTDSAHWYQRVQTSSDRTLPWRQPGVKFQMKGIKGNISYDGYEMLAYANNGHVEELMTAFEDPTKCTQGGCWLLVGWRLGTAASQGTCGSATGYVPRVFVEIFDDTNQPCYTHGYFDAPSNASYDTRYYATVTDIFNGQPVTRYRYQVYYETPGSNNIQVLAYGDLVQMQTAQTAGLEVSVPAATPANTCNFASGPNTSNYHGLYVANTFAEQMQLYNGSGWVDWTNTVVATTVYATNYSPTLGTDNPYDLTVDSAWPSFTKFHTGGPRP